MPNPEGSANPLDELESRIQKNPDVVTRSDIERAYKNAEDQISRQFEGMTDPAADAVKEKQLQKIREMRDKQIKELEEIKSTRSTGGSKVIAEARLLLADVKSYTSNRDKRHGDRDRAYTAAGKKADQIDDYQGIDALHNETRDIFAGYLAAYEAYDPSKAGEELAKAKGVYDKSNPGILDFDKVLKKDEMMNGLDMAKYAALFDGYDLTDEGKGLMIGYMSVAEKFFKNAKEKDEYKAYVIDLLKSLQDSGKLKPDAYLESSKREIQRVTLEVVMNPKEWQESNAVKDTLKIKNRFQSLKDVVKKLKDNLGYTPGDAAITALLNKKPDDLTAADEAAITSAAEKIKTESGALLNTKTKGAQDQIALLKTRLQEVTSKNNSQNKIQKTELDKVSNNLKQAEAGLAAIVLTAATSDEIATQAAKLNAANGMLSPAAAQIDQMEKAFAVAGTVVPPVVPPTGGDKNIPPAGDKLGGKTDGDKFTPGNPDVPATGDVYRDGWSRAVTVDSGFSNSNLQVARGITEAVYRGNDGAVKGKIPGGTELAMVDTKGLKINNTVFIKVKYKDEEVWVDKAQLTISDKVPAVTDTVENVGVQKFMEEKNLKAELVNGKLEYSYGSKKVIDPLVPGSNLNKSGNSEVDKFFLEVIRIYGVQVPQEKQLQLYPIIQQALLKSKMTFEKKPTLEEIISAYDNTFAPAWNDAIKKLSSMPSNINTGSATLDEDVKKILGTEWPIPDYTEGFNAVARYIKNPEQYKDGVTFNVPFNNLQVGCSLKYENGTSGNVIVVPNIDPRPRYTFDSPQKFMQDLNKGYLAAWMTEKVLSSKANYGAYSGLVGKTDFVDKGEYNERGEKWPIHAEFDWEGALDDPDVYLRAMPYGQIKFAIQWQHVNSNGENWRVGYANSMEDFFKIMKHYRDWGNRFGDLNDDNRNREMNKELLYDKIVNPYYYNNKGGKIGNVVKFSTSVDNRVDLVLDWGGGQNAESPANARLAVWIGNDGMVHYSVENTGLSNVETTGTALDPNDVVRQVEQIKNKAGKGPSTPVMVIAR